MNRRNQDLWLKAAFAGLLLAVVLMAWLCQGPVKGDPVETMALKAEYEQLAREYPAK